MRACTWTSTPKPVLPKRSCSRSWPTSPDVADWRLRLCLLAPKGERDDGVGQLVNGRAAARGVPLGDRINHAEDQPGREARIDLGCKVSVLRRLRAKFGPPPVEGPAGCQRALLVFGVS